MTSSKSTWIVLALMGIMAAAIIALIAAWITVDYFKPGAEPGVLPPSGGTVNPLATVSAAPGQISGLVWHDLCASSGQEQSGQVALAAGCVSLGGGGFFANGLREAGEPGIPGVTVVLGSGDCPATGFAETLTVEDGSFHFPGLLAGSYCISVDPSLGLNAGILLPGGWSAPSGVSLAAKSVSLVSEETVAGIEFGWDYQFQPVPPTPTATVTSTPTPTHTPTITPTPVPTIPCDWAGFVKDVTIPDGTILKPEQDFSKTWRLKNIGSCTWTKAYALVFVNGNRMTGDSVTPLLVSVQPAQTIDISIDLVAPLQAGKHTGYWALRNAAGVIFGLGSAARDPFSVSVHVEKPKQTKIIYDLAEHYCTATWVSAAGEIECPSPGYDVSGFIQRLDAPVMEGGRVENEQGLWVIPEGVSGGFLSGTFPPFKVESGDRFRSVVSCVDAYNACDVQFRLEYKIGGGEVMTLGKWGETYNGEFTKIDVDLTPLAGKEVRFIMTIRAGDTFDQDSGLWLRPSVWR